ncbi:uncharacterized protein LOC126252577 [Schistocerca nitens]|uniref:uncharacterized protein LOC126252577 n=1 Tax=Schistocerca nitens TaxID=7011 RepID=UPI00211836FD|nr:uncharacterized protein LOC126252577 [Schistocerca nitens]
MRRAAAAIWAAVAVTSRLRAVSDSGLVWVARGATPPDPGSKKTGRLPPLQRAARCKTLLCSADDTLTELEAELGAEKNYPLQQQKRYVEQPPAVDNQQQHSRIALEEEFDLLDRQLEDFHQQMQQQPPAKNEARQTNCQVLTRTMTCLNGSDTAALIWPY